ncbi:structural protein P5 [Roseospira visakhapatnamensis]|uniref:Structural protein P5 n=1 Tax=Roseospira visakhapatnamensis TaxID=390880 RepID=A0A7W6RGX3_9PROT|nr:structural protein P5 [Roseospira visakhapatnamensis]MBB4267824.1 hypothetical protein [Roseospira visakhapatnamensis]
MTDRPFSVPRGIRNHNPGNIERGAPWQGLADPADMTAEQRAEPRFCVFAAPKWGIRALARVLITYQDKHGLRTVRGMISRWAPKADQNNTEAYIRMVADRLGVAHDTAIDVHTYDVARALVEAIISHENGMQPYDRAMIDTGLALAGIEPPVLITDRPAPALPTKPAPRPLRQTSTGKTGAAGLLAVGGTVLTVAAENADAVLDAATNPAVRALITAAPWVGGALAGLAVLAILLLLARKHRLETA